MQRIRPQGCVVEARYSTLLFPLRQPESHKAGEEAESIEMIIETAAKIEHRSDVFVLAQASMARVEAKIRERTGKPVLSSPEPCLLHIKSLFGK